MLASGNSAIGPCVYCLMTAMQREIPFARSKGIDPDVYDMPISNVTTYLDETARSAIKTYEPRVDSRRLELNFGAIDGGGMGFTIMVDGKPVGE